MHRLFCLLLPGLLWPVVAGEGDVVLLPGLRPATAPAVPLAGSERLALLPGREGEDGEVDRLGWDDLREGEGWTPVAIALAARARALLGELEAQEDRRPLALEAVAAVEREAGGETEEGGVAGPASDFTLLERVRYEAPLAPALLGDPFALHARWAPHLGNELLLLVDEDDRLWLLSPLAPNRDELLANWRADSVLARHFLILDSDGLRFGGTLSPRAPR